VFVILYSLPWSGKELFEKREMEFNKILYSVQNYLSKRSKMHLKALSVWTSKKPHEQEDVSRYFSTIDWNPFTRTMSINI